MPRKGRQRPIGATDSGPSPGDYALCSLPSRAAARAIVEQRTSGKDRFDFIVDIGITIDDLKIGEWTEDEDGRLTRVSLIPEGMSMEEAERIVSERRLWGESISAATRT